MDRHVDAELRNLKQLILSMGGHVENSIEYAINALTHRDSKIFQKVYEAEKAINRLQMEVDDACLKVFAKESPLASDLRFVIAVIKINTDLERMGDQAVNISHNGEAYLKEPPLKPLIDLPKMASEVQWMVRSSLDAFVRNDSKLAEDVLERDDVVDQYKNDIFNELKILMQQDGQSISRAMNLILIARNLERLADHATNIAEEVIFVISGLDVRHGNRNKMESLKE